MALDSYANLQLDIANFLNRSDLTAVIPDFITLAEAQMNRRLIAEGPVRQMMLRADATISSEFVQLPVDFLGARSMLLNPTTDVPAPQYVEPEKIVELKVSYPTQDGDPRVYSVVGNEFQFWPYNGGTYQAELTYWQRIPALGNTNRTNWLLTAHPDAYLYGALMQSAPYLKDDARVQVWGTAFAQILADMVAADKIARFAPTLSIPRNPYIGDN